jgi:predicted DNA-binding transcriptional regulator AlpA
VATTSLGTIDKWSSPSWHDAPELLTARDLEALLKIDVKTIYSYVQRGLIPYVKIQSNVRFSKFEIFNWIKEHSHRPRGRADRAPTRHKAAF